MLPSVIVGDIAGILNEVAASKEVDSEKYASEEVSCALEDFTL
jgi:hypothetical protein